MSLRHRLSSATRRLVVQGEHAWDAVWLVRSGDRPPRHFRIEPYLGFGTAGEVLVRGRVLDNAEPPSDVRGEGTGDAVRRTLARFLTRELPGVPLRIRVGAGSAEVVTDREGYFAARLSPGSVEGPWVDGTADLVRAYRGLTGRSSPLRVRVPQPSASFGVISDVDDTILHTGAQRTAQMVAVTFTGSALTRTPMPGAPELYQALTAGRTGTDGNPVFYVSSSPWNLHGFLTAFLEHRAFPLGPLLLRDLLGTGAGRTHATSKLASVDEVLALHPGLPFVLLGDSGQHDPEIYAEVVRRYPGRVLAVYIREVRLDPGDGRVEKVTDRWDGDVPFVVAADSAAIARHAAGAGLLPPAAADAVERATAASR